MLYAIPIIFVALLPAVRIYTKNDNHDGTHAFTIRCSHINSYWRKTSCITGI
jgi:hypothetical protein